MTLKQKAQAVKADMLEIKERLGGSSTTEISIIELCDLVLSLPDMPKGCPCGDGWILADTEDCRVPVCPNCAEEIAAAISKMRGDNE